MADTETPSVETRPAAIVCAISGTKLIAAVPADFDTFDKGTQFTILTSYAEEHGFVVHKDAGGKRYFLCPECAGAKKVPLLPFKKKQICPKCLNAEVLVDYSAGAQMVPGSHLQYRCKKCKHFWNTQTADAQKGRTDGR